MQIKFQNVLKSADENIKRKIYKISEKENIF